MSDDKPVADDLSDYDHKHLWEMGEPLEDRPGVLYNGVKECPCGISVWMADGVRAAQPQEPEEQTDPLLRIMEYKAKLDAGETLDDDEIADIRAIAEAMVAAFKPFMEALQKLAEDVAKGISAFYADLDPYHRDLLMKVHDMAEVGSLDDDSNRIVVAQGGSLVGEIPIMGGVPIPGLNHVAMDNQLVPTHEVVSQYQREMFEQNRNVL